MARYPIPHAGWALLTQQFATVIDRRYNVADQFVTRIGMST